MNEIRTAERHGWKSVGVVMLGNVVYTQMAFGPFLICVYPPTGRVFASPAHSSRVPQDRAYYRETRARQNRPTYTPRKSTMIATNAVATIRVGEKGAAAWEEIDGLFVRPLGSAPTLAELHDRLIRDGLAPEDEIFIEDCLFGDEQGQRPTPCIPRYRFVHYHGAGGVGAGRHLVRIN